MDESTVTAIHHGDYFDGPPSTTPIPPKMRTIDGDRAVALLRVMGDMIIHCTLAFDGFLDEHRLARAFRLLIDAEPQFGCHLITNKWWQPIWIRRDDIETRPLCTVEHIDEPDEDVPEGEQTPLEQALEAYKVRPFALDRDPHLEGRIFRSPRRDVLCIKVSHCIADAGGSKETAYLLASLYQALGRDPGHQVEPNLHGDRSIGQLLSKLSWREKGRIVLRNMKDTWARIYPIRRINLLSPAQPVKRPSYAYRHLSPEQCRALKQLGRQHGATVNDVLISAQARGFSRFLGFEEGMAMRLTNTVDLRRYLPGRKTGGICNFSAFSTPRLGPWQPEEPFTETLQRANREMNALKQDMIGTGDIPLLRHGVRLVPFWLNRLLMIPMLKVLRYILPPAFTNMGQIDPDALSFGDVDVAYGWLTASVLYPPFIAGGISGFGDQITLSMGFCDDAFPRDRVEALFDAIVAELPTPQD